MKDLFARLLTRYLALIGAVAFAVDPNVPGATPAGEAATAPAGDAGDDAPQQPANDATNADADHRDKAIRKLERRIGNRTRALGERDATIAQLRQQLAERERTPDPDDTNDDGRPAQPRQQPQDVEGRARELAQEMRHRETIATRTQAMLDKGKEIENFRQLALEVADELPFVDGSGRATPFIEAVLDSDHPHLLLAHIARNDLAETFVGLTPTQLGRRLAKLEVEASKKPERRSGAPEPHAPVAGRGDTSRDERGMTDAEWRAARQQQRGRKAA